MKRVVVNHGWEKPLLQSFAFLLVLYTPSLLREFSTAYFYCSLFYFRMADGSFLNKLQLSGIYFKIQKF